MADVARLLPRHWDGRRLLRFMAGLAMLALAFAAHAGLISPAPAIAAPVTVVSAVEAPMTAVEAPAAVAETPVMVAEAPPVEIVPANPVLPRSVDLPVSAAQSAHGSRAPPGI